MEAAGRDELRPGRVEELRLDEEGVKCGDESDARADGFGDV